MKTLRWQCNATVFVFYVNPDVTILMLNSDSSLFDRRPKDPILEVPGASGATIRENCFF